MPKQYTRTESKLKVMPDLSAQERLFIQEIIAGSSYTDAWNRAYDPDEKLVMTEQQRKTKSRALLKKRRIRQWTEYLQSATTEELVEDLYTKEIAFGDGQRAMKAADAFLESQFAGKEVAEIFLRTLQQIGAKIVVPCSGGACKADA